MRAERDDGSALMLLPAAVLVLLVLAAITVDSAIAFLGERELAATVAAAANDAAVAGIDREQFYRCGALTIDRRAATRVAEGAVRGRSSDAVRLTKVGVATDTGTTAPQVTVRAQGVVELIFSRALPGGRDHAVVGASAVASARLPDAGAGEVGCDR